MKRFLIIFIVFIVVVLPAAYFYFYTHIPSSPFTGVSVDNSKPTQSASQDHSSIGLIPTTTAPTTTPSHTNPVSTIISKIAEVFTPTPPAIPPEPAAQPATSTTASTTNNDTDSEKDKNNDHNNDKGDDTPKNYNVTKSVLAYGSVSTVSINAAIIAARAYFLIHPDAIYTIQIPAGTYSVPRTIDVSNVIPGPNGRLIIEGAGKTATVLMQTIDDIGIRGNNTYRTTFQDMHFALPNNTVTQGTVVSVSATDVIIDIPPGFPTPLDVFDPHYDLSEACPDEPAAAGGWGRYIKYWTNSKTDPHIDDVYQPQYAWCKPVAVPGNPLRWDIVIKGGKGAPPFALGTLVTAKSKSGESAYAFCKGDDFTFKNIEWTQRTRGFWHCGFNDVHVLDSSIIRPAPIKGQAFALSSSGGGPQIGEPEIPTHGHLVEGNNFTATGDDVVALFNADGVLRNNQISDAYGDVLIGVGSDVCMTGNTIVRTNVDNNNNGKKNTSTDDDEQAVCN